MLITAAGTSAPMATAAKANPLIQLGKRCLKRAGTTSLLLVSFNPATKMKRCFPFTPCVGITRLFQAHRHPHPPQLQAEPRQH
jgi:hypothetical protein